MSRIQILSFAILGIILSVYSIFTLDQKIAPLLLAADQSAIETWTFITDIVSSKHIAILLIVTWIAAFTFARLKPKNPLWPIMQKKAALIFASVLAAGGIALVIKFIVGRARPYMGDIGFSPFTYAQDFASWPSGHTTTAFAFAVAVGMAVPILRWPMVALAGLIGYSRMVLGMHYFADVIIGATLGTLCAVLVYNWLRPKFGLKA